MEQLAEAIRDGMCYHVFSEGTLLQSFYFPGSAAAFASSQRNRGVKHVQVKYLTNNLTEEKLA